MEKYVEEILEKLGTGFTVEIPVTKETLEPYLKWLAEERGVGAVKMISFLSKSDLQRAIAALYRCESLEEFFDAEENENDFITNEDVMITLKRSDISVEKYGTTDKGFSEIEK